MLDARPWVKLLREIVEREGTGAASELLGLSQRRIYTFLHNGQETVELDTVDQALLNTPYALWELYPDLYEMEEAA